MTYRVDKKTHNSYLMLWDKYRTICMFPQTVENLAFAWHDFAYRAARVALDLDRFIHGNNELIGIFWQLIYVIVW